MAYSLLSLHLSPHTTTCVLIPLHVSSYHHICILIGTARSRRSVPHYFVSSYHCIYVLVSSICVHYIYVLASSMCPHTTIYMCPPHRYRSQVAFCNPLLRVLIPLYICPRVLLIGTARSWRSVSGCSPAHPPGCRRALYGSLLRYSVYLLYWYKRTNTDECWQ